MTILPSPPVISFPYPPPIPKRESVPPFLLFSPSPLTTPMRLYLLYFQLPHLKLPLFPFPSIFPPPKRKTLLNHSFTPFNDSSLLLSERNRRTYRQIRPLIEMCCLN